MYELGSIYNIPCLAGTVAGEEELCMIDKDGKLLNALKTEVEELARTLKDISNWMPLMKFLKKE